MTTTPHATVDTRLMVVVHRAITRDLHRMEETLGGEPLPDRQRAAVARHSLWLMALLRAHEQEEDGALWPVLRERSPQSGHLLDELERDHEALAQLSTGLEASTERWQSDPEAQAEVHVAVGMLEGVLIPHLLHEEEQALPAAAQTLTEEDWAAYARIRAEGRSRRDVAFEVPWLLDELDPAGADVVTRGLGPLARLGWLPLLGRRYRTAAAVRWSGEPRDYGPRSSSTSE